MSRPRGSYETALLPERFWFVGVFVLAPFNGDGVGISRDTAFG